MEKKIYEHIFKTKFDAHLDGWMVDARGYASDTPVARRG
jgi:hypothetical protein